MHSFAKLVTKLLASRHASKLQGMVSPNQSAFIKGHFIQDNFILVQQTARFLHQQKQPRILLKLDISRAFDSVSWPSLLEVMQQLGFGQIWRDIISGLLSTSSTRVLLNGIPGEFISHQRGLQQGDPLSPMLFILAMDVLGYIVTKVESEGMLLPLSTRNLRHRVSIYADDVVLFLLPVVDDIAVTLDILHLFGTASGLRNNVQKSSVFPIRCEEADITVLQDMLPCDIFDFPCRYLGLPLSLKKLTWDQAQPIIDSSYKGFWTDRWLHGQRVSDIAPRLFAIIPKRRVSKRTVQDTLINRTWISDIQGAITVGVIVEYLHLWDILLDLELQHGVNDTHFWSLSSNGVYSTKSAYESMFLGLITFEPYSGIWKTWHLLNVGSLCG